MAFETKPLSKVIYQKDAETGVARIILNNPEKANAQGHDICWGVEECLYQAEADHDVKVVILKANGKGFCSGHVYNGDGTAENLARASERFGTGWKGTSDVFLWPCCTSGSFRSRPSRR